MRVQQLVEMFLDTDVRDALPLIQTPTLVMHRRGDRVVNYRAAPLARRADRGQHLRRARGPDHFPWVGDSDGAAGGDRGVPHRRAARRRPPSACSPPSSSPTSSTRPVSRPRWATVAGASCSRSTRRWSAAHLERFGGREIKTTGDGFLATFDGPTRAVECARAIADDMPALGIQVRAGIHTGEVELIGDDVGGIAVHVAARVSALAGAGEVLASRTVRDLAAGSGITFEPKGRHALKGVADEWDIYEVRVHSALARRRVGPRMRPAAGHSIAWPACGGDERLTRLQRLAWS